MKLSPKYKTWLTVAGMALLAASSITWPVDLKGMIPSFLSDPMLGNFSVVNIAAYAVLVGAYWVATKQTS